jgi:hypothetical protein
MLLLIFLLASYGVTNIVTGGKIFKPLRDLLKPVPALGYWIQCEMCFGFAVGVAWGALGLWPDLGIPLWKQLMAAGAVSSGWCWMTRVALYRLGEDDM